MSTIAQVKKVSMNGQVFKSVLRSVLGYIGEGLMWTGVPLGMSAAIAAKVSTHARNRANPRLGPRETANAP